MALAKLTALFDPGPPHECGVHPTALVAADAIIGEGVSIGPYAVVGPRSRIGAGTTIMPQVTVGADAAIGAQCLLHSGVRIGHGCRLGDRVIVHANAVIGADGFSFAPDLMSASAFTAGVKVTRVHSLGNVEIGDDVEIGACTTIDRATLESTRIGRGSKIDDHVHIGHNVVIGESCILCGMVGISGSVDHRRPGAARRRRRHRRPCAHRRSGGGRRRFGGGDQRAGGRLRVRLSGAAAPAHDRTAALPWPAKAAP